MARSPHSSRVTSFSLRSDLTSAELLQRLPVHILSRHISEVLPHLSQGLCRLPGSIGSKS